MNLYLISKDSWSCRYPAEDLITAEAYANGLGEGYVVAYVGAYTPAAIPEKLTADEVFCQSLTTRFIEENRQAGITDSEAASLLTEFKDIMSMAQVGAVPSVYALLQGVTVGTIYTQARKDRDLADLAAYMAS